MNSIYTNQDGNVLGLVNPPSEIFVVQLVGKVNRHSYRQVFKKILLEAKKQPYASILLNIRDLENNPDLGKRWFTTYFMRRFYKITGNMRLAIVKPQNPVEDISVGLFYSLINSLGISVKVKFFDQVPKASAWLEEQDYQSRYSSSESEKVKEIKLDKNNRLKLRLHFSPKGDLENNKERNSLLPSLKLGKTLFGE